MDVLWLMTLSIIFDYASAKRILIIFKLCILYNEYTVVAILYAVCI